MQKKIRSEREQELERGFLTKVRKNAPVVIMIVAILALSYTLYVRHSENENLKNQIDSSIRKADSLRDAGSFEEAIDEYEGILEVVSPKKFPNRYATTQNNLGLAYRNLAEVRAAEENLEKAINSYQEALKIYTVESYPIPYAKIKSNLEKARDFVQTPT